ncbi:hypothetical protein NE237_005256 [Protea cynaroides]|uniref:Uncharacterized protein n=1 Tax=Protea cynaroides TaxID=273540 RepID=A0A9Q0KKA1_9MAGN|nr:hypothetical protein NE237_005256 [Protea cynaroides]
MRKEEIRWEREGIRRRILKPGFEGYGRERKVSKLLERVAQEGVGRGLSREKPERKEGGEFRGFFFPRLEIVGEKGLGLILGRRKSKERRRGRRRYILLDSISNQC